MSDVYLTQKDIDYISRVVATEVPASIAQTDPAEYSRMVGAVVDTITNRMASGEYPSTVTGVVNQRNQFSAINGPIDGAYGKVQNAPKASPELQSLVAGHIADISQGVEESEIGGSMNYANPNFSSANNLRDWVNPMIEAGAVKLGLGDSVHYHGIIPGDEAVGPYNLSAEGIPTTQNVAVPVDNPMKGLLAVVDPFDPNSSLRTGSLMAPMASDWGAMAQANIAANQTPSLIGPDVQMLSTSTQPIGQPVEVASADDSGWGLNRDVAPALVPTMNSWAPVAAAEPVSSPLGSVQATGLLAGTPALDASTAVRGLPEIAPAISQADIDRTFFNATGQGQIDPSFTEGLMAPNNPVVPTAVESTTFTPGATEQATDIASSRFSTPATTSRIGQTPAMDMARMPGLLDVATNTQSFMDQPSAPADLGNMPDAYAAQRGPSTGLLSADFQALQGNTERQVQDPSTWAPAVQSHTAMMNVPAAGLLAANAPLEAQATVPSIQQTTVTQPAIDNTVTGSTTPGLLSPSSIATANVPMSFTAPTGIIPGQPVQQNAFVDSFPAAVTNNTIEAAPVNEVPAPALEAVQIAEQPAVVDQNAVVEGPATTPALEQQQAAVTPTDTVPSTVSKPATQNKGLLSGLLSKETALGGLLGGLALGPAGGVLGALAGQQVARSGGLGSMLGGNSFSAPTTQMPGGISNIASIYGGSQAPGTYAVANNGATITAQPGGWSTYENKYGVVEAIGPDGKISSYFGGNANPTDPNTETSTNSGGLFGGLFG